MKIFVSFHAGRKFGNAIFSAAYKRKPIMNSKTYKFICDELEREAGVSDLVILNWQFIDGGLMGKIKLFTFLCIGALLLFYVPCTTVETACIGTRAWHETLLFWAWILMIFLWFIEWLKNEEIN